MPQLRQNEKSGGAMIEIMSDDDFVLFKASKFPFWLYDFDRFRISWANDAALNFWRAETIDELAGRDLSRDMSPAIRRHLDQLQSDLQSQTYVDEQWCFYPKGELRQMLCRFRGVRLADGRTAMLCEGNKIEDTDSDIIWSRQALNYSDAMVMIYAYDGTCLYGNPAARRAFSLFDRPLNKRISNRELVDHLLTEEAPNVEGRYTTSVNSQHGPRLHAITVRRCIDPTSGAPALMMTEMDITEQEHARTRLAYFADHDQLTGVGNRYLLERQGAELLRKAILTKQHLVVILFDLVKFKAINDLMGHTTGDAVLRTIALRLQSWATGEVVLARLGGDEFCVLALAPPETVKPIGIARQLQRLLSRTMQVEGQDIKPASRFGISIGPTHAENFEELLRKADLALTATKASKNEDMIVYHASMSRAAARFEILSKEIREAHRRGSFELHYQPRVSVLTGKIIGVEALIRLKTSAGELVAPDEFLPVAQSNGSIVTIGRWALRQAVQELKGLNVDGAPLGISVNIDARQFADPLLVPLLRELADSLPGKAQQLELELTETSMLSENSRTKRVIESIHNAGFPLSIDDFGKAYSNLSRLRSFPIHRLKIDRSMVSDPPDLQLLQSVQTIAAAMGTKVVAEGIEHANQLDMIRSLGIEEYQGFLYSTPMSIDRLITHLQSLSKDGGAVLNSALL